MKWRNPDGQSPAGSQKRPASKKKAKKGGDGEDDEDDDDDDGTKVKVEVLLATKWDLVTGSDPAGWWMSEKLDGVRYVGFRMAANGLDSWSSSVYWDGNQMLSRLGNPFTPPQWFKDSVLFPFPRLIL
jgi:DNA ligase-1